jgi:hypothetical protein
MTSFYTARTGNKRYFWWLVLPALIAAVLIFARAGAEPESVTRITILPTVRQADVKPIGLNIGAHRHHEANQILKNVVVNPGFEPSEFATIFHALPEATGTRVQQSNWETSWNNPTVGHPPQFWNGATFEVLTGNAVGRTGTISNFTHEDNRYTWYLSPTGTAPQGGAAIMARIQKAGYTPGTLRFGAPDPGTVRPGSAGSQSLRLDLPADYWRSSFSYYFDSLSRSDSSAGKMVIVDGEWQFEIWARAARSGDQLEVYFWRENAQLFWRHLFTLTTSWQKYSATFSVPPGADSLRHRADWVPDYGDWVPPVEPGSSIPLQSREPILELAFRIGGNQGAVWVDDVVLQRANQTNPTVFSDRFVALLRELNPGILRNWGLQLGSSLDNQLAPPGTRRTTDHSPRNPIARSYHYSLHEFLQLSQYLGAEPWYVIPPTFSADEMQNLMGYLAAPVGAHPYAARRAALGQSAPWTTVFPVIHLEFGNEAWGSNAHGDAFIGASLSGGERLGQLAHRRFAALRAAPSFDPDRFNLIIGGQNNIPYRQGQIEEHSTNHDTIALAPYSDLSLTSYATNAERYYPQFARARQDVTTGLYRQSLQNLRPTTGVAIYEFNLHTTFYDPAAVPIGVRNEFVTGLNSGLAVPLYFLHYLSETGVRDLVAYQTLQYSVAIQEDRDAPIEYVRLWGLMRDLEATGRPRPAWYGLKMVNQVMKGDMLEVSQSGTPIRRQQPLNDLTAPIDLPLVQAYAFQDGPVGGVLLFNLDLTNSRAVELTLPVGVLPFATRTVLTASDIRWNNEESVRVRPVSTPVNDLSPLYPMTLPRHSLTLLTWATETQEQYLPLVFRDWDGITSRLWLPIVLNGE